jgi:alpha-L-rhamnosidase
MTRIDHLTTEYRDCPLGIDVLHPRFSWQMLTERHGARQTAYRVQAATHPDRLHSPDLWDSGTVASDQSVHIAYAGQALRSRQRVFWRVTVWDETGSASKSDPVWFEMGLLQPADWQAEWIGAPVSGGLRSMLPVPAFRKAFHLPAAVMQARLYITALGLLQPSINGQPVGADVFAPGWTDYNKRIQYLTYDVSALLQRGDNAIGVLLGDGWAVGYQGWLGRQNYVDRPQLLAQLEVECSDGSRHTIISDPSWTIHFGAITHSDFLMGEAHDARKQLIGWDTPAFQPENALQPLTFSHPQARLVAHNSPTVRRIQELAPISDPVSLSIAGRRRFIFDLGQNMVGWVRFKGQAHAGTTITLRFAEVTNPDGSLYTANLRAALCTDYYTFKGDGEEVWEPSFTFHGFRYVEIEGYPGEVSRDTITGVVLHSDLPQTGSFECSDPLLNQLQHNIIWGQKGNFVDVPTDCPQRDERLGWTGDIQVFVRTAAFNMNVASFMTRWAADVTDSQNPDGSVPAVVPFAAKVPTDGGPAWADAAIICPWTIYLCYGDRSILETSYETMTRFMDFLLNTSPGYIRCAPDYEGWPGFGDWLSINASTPRDLLGTAFLAYDASLLARIAAILGKPDDAARFQHIFEGAREAFQRRYLIGSSAHVETEAPSAIRKQMDDADRISRGNLQQVDYGEIRSQVFNTDLFTPTQTSYVLALYFNLLPADLQPLAVSELVADLERRGMHLSTGFVGSPYLNHVLSEHGRLDIAYALLNQKSWPSWLYAVTQGATTIWERWDGWTEEFGFQTPEMNSFNHYAYGAIGAWMYSTIAGIDLDPNRPGYRHIILRPQPGGDLTHASARLQTLYGEVTSAWKRDQAAFRWEIVVPPNTTATAYLPPFGTHAHINGDPIDGTTVSLQAGRYQIMLS